MKRVLSIVMAILLLCLSGCGEVEPVSFGNLDPVTTAPETSAETTASSTTGETKQAVATSSKSKNNGTTTAKPTKTTATTRPVSSYEEAPDYTLLPTREVDEWQTVRFHNPATDVQTWIDIPADWTLAAKDKRTWTIQRDGKAIGVITSAALSDPKDYFSPGVAGINQGWTDVNWQVNWHKENGKDRFYRHFEIACKPTKDITFLYKLRVEYTELDDQAVETLAQSVGTSKQEIFVPLSQTNGSKKILIVGDENIASSQIEDFLNDMLMSAGSEYMAEAVSREGGNVLVFANDLKLSKSIRNGEYAYVFQGGLYTSDRGAGYNPKKSAADFDAMRSLCEVSKTALVIFPSYNEVVGLGQDIREAYYDVRLLNWQQEQEQLRNIFYITLEELYGGGCSTPLAGYVGAHMIYRTLFGEIPPPLTDRSPLSWEEVKNALYSYPEKGSDAFRQDADEKEYTIQ